MTAQERFVEDLKEEQRNALERIRDIKRSVHPHMWNPAAALEECIRIAREALDAPAVAEPPRQMAGNKPSKGAAVRGAEPK